MSQSHKEALMQLCPVKLGENHDADMEIEGQHLDEIADDAAALKNEFFPDTCTADGCLEDWERVLDIPGDCPGLASTASGRVKAVAAKWAEKRKINKASLIDVAGNLGYTVTITNYTARRYGQAVCGGEYIGKEWANTLTVNVAAAASSVADGLDDLIEDESGESITAEGGLAGTEVLECAMTRRQPGHTYMEFNYEE